MPTACSGTARRSQTTPGAVSTRNGGWRWEEFTRTSPRQRFTRVAFPESGCAACHAQAKATDYVFTRR